MKSLTMKKNCCLILLFCVAQLFAQYPSREKPNNSLKTDSIVFDAYNGDGIFKARNPKTKKWGSFQVFSGDIIEQIPMKYDSLGFYDKSQRFTLVKNNGKYGIIGRDREGFKYETAIIYDKLAIIDYTGKYAGLRKPMIAARKNGKWGYIHEVTGDTLLPFGFNKKVDLPKPDPIYYDYPLKKFSDEYYSIFNNPNTITELDLSFQSLNFLPKELKNCSRLKVLNLEGNFYEHVPEILKELPNLEELYLGGNIRIDEDVHHETYHLLTELKNLRKLSLSGGIHKSLSFTKRYYSRSLNLPEGFTFPPNLEGLYIGNIDDEELELVYNYPNLKELRIGGTFAHPLEFDFERLASKDNLEGLYIDLLGFVDDFNTHIPSYKKLDDVEIDFLEPDSGNIGNIKQLKNLDELYMLIYFRDTEDDEGVNYTTSRIADAYFLRNNNPTKEEIRKKFEKIINDFKMSYNRNKKAN